MVGPLEHPELATIWRCSALNSSYINTNIVCTLLKRLAKISRVRGVFLGGPIIGVPKVSPSSHCPAAKSDVPAHPLHFRRLPRHQLALPSVSIVQSYTPNTPTRRTASGRLPAAPWVAKHVFAGPVYPRSRTQYASSFPLLRCLYFLLCRIESVLLEALTKKGRTGPYETRSPGGRRRRHCFLSNWTKIIFHLTYFMYKIVNILLCVPTLTP